MSTYSDEEKRATLERSRILNGVGADAREISEPEPTREELLRQALARPYETRNERDRREITEQEERRMNRAKWTTDSTFARRLEAKCAAMIDEAKTEQKDHITQLLTEANEV